MHKLSTVIPIGVIFILKLTCAQNHHWNQAGKSIVFEETFDGDTLNETIWQIDEGNAAFGSNKEMCYTKHNKNVRVESGYLIVSAAIEVTEVDCDLNKKTSSKRRYTSGRIKSKDKIEFSALEFEARFPKGSHLQPGLWMQKSMTGLYEEIDVAEAVGIETLKYYVNAHWGKKYNELVQGIKGGPVTQTPDLSLEFHYFAVEIQPSALNFYFDKKFVKAIPINEQQWRSFPNAPIVQYRPFTKPKHIIISLLIGGNWFRDKLSLDKAQKWKKTTLEINRITAYE